MASPLFKSPEAVDVQWATAGKHLSCMQDPPNIQLYVATKVVTINGVQLNRYRCRRGSNTLEGLHAHLLHAIPSKRCGIIPFQVYLISFAMQWNNRMEKLKVAGGRGRLTSCVDPRQIQTSMQRSCLGRTICLSPIFLHQWSPQTITTLQKKSFWEWTMPTASPLTSHPRNITFKKHWFPDCQTLGTYQIVYIPT
ncbi:uncharacterized protein LOC119742771 [Patiria miniata]|uniref:Uncharacterized protein n=1 Tax=Patiria miniata TaxID=46514 RepID=A0A914BFL3_PATMI|nr:uncharacterized protein LOC119742771 [Patiria miniata]